MSTVCKLLSVLAALTLASSSFAQTPAAASAPATLPTAPAGINYRYWPHQYFQWIGPELPYSMIELDVDDRGSTPLYDATLVDRASKKRVHYTNQQAEVSVVEAGGAEAHLVAMQFDAPAEAVNGSTYLLQFATETGVPVAWQLVQGTDISERGSGLSQVDSPTPLLLYREQAGLAGEGSALKVGNVTSTIEEWKEMSQPPYFTAYHGAISQDVHVVAFLPRTVDWKVDPSTAAVTAGADWKLATATGRTISAHVDSFAGGLVVLHEVDPVRGTSVMVEAKQEAHGWALQRIKYGPALVAAAASRPGKSDKAEEHAVSFTFTLAGEPGSTKFEVVQGKKTHLASGTATLGAAESWVLTQPAWAHKPAIVASQTQTR